MDTLEGLNLRKYSPGELKDFTDNFSGTNLFGETQFGKVYRGKTQQGQDVTLKIWEDVGDFPVGRDEHRSQLMKECIFLMEPSVRHHPNLAKLLGYCCEDTLLGVVYDLKPLDTVHNLIAKDHFSWLHRVKVAIDLARLLEFLHGVEPPYLVRNFGPPHIMLDQDYNPVLFDFGIITGGVFGKNQRIPNIFTLGLEGYFDPTITLTGKWLDKNDAYSFGAVLLELISKRLYERGQMSPNPVFRWANIEYVKKKKKHKKLFFSFGPLKFSVVHGSLEKDSNFSQKDGYKITKLGIRCVQGLSLTSRLKMPEVVQCLLSLDVLRHLNDKGN
ncbi:probable serine/threonine-protein kinase PBL10 isoform X2 [Cornus florida]|uniref:probable serine/threonine-protein kinase PBL10 isoform X2 n=1 Tax=Cornus florida TaxID=4283 RepID=UPI00289F51EE|nr:probable serine/threonine-protein kinase PBL10 isoform X2 [Cornus florida]